MTYFTTTRPQADEYDREMRHVLRPIIRDLASGAHNWQFGDDDLPRALAHFVEAVCDTCRADIDAIASQFGNRAIYPDMPAVKLFGCDGEQGDSWPDIWLMSWRRLLPGEDGTAECTTIHDHGPSHAAIHVMAGDVCEVHYDVDRAAWRAGANPLPCGKPRVVILEPGQTLTIPVPYIHRMMDTVRGREGYSVHSYFPGLKHQRSYLHVGNELYRNGGWDETEGECQL